MKTLHLLLMLLTLLGLGGCTSDQLSGGPIDGVVLDRTTQKPLAGAIVVAQWQGRISGSWVDSKTVCYHVATAVSDREGGFYIPAWKSSLQEKGFQTGIYDRWLAMDAYHPGYDYGQVSKNNQLIYLKPFKGTARERMDQIHRYTGRFSCRDAGVSRKNQRALFRALYEEGKPLAETKEDFFVLGIWLRYSETLGDE